MTRNKTIAVLAATAVVALVAGLGIGVAWRSNDAAAPGTDTAADGEREILYWVAPMDPSYRRDEPGKSPMGMDLVPVYADGTRGGAGVSADVSIDPRVSQSLGVRTEPAARGDLPRRVRALGSVALDENRISRINVRTAGWIDRLAVKTESEQVEKGQLLFELYAPELVNAQEELVQALSAGDQSLISASRDRLSALGLSPRQIETLAETRDVRQRVRIYAPQDGVVAELNVREGQHVMTHTVVMTLADLSSIWVTADVFERQAAWVAPGQRARVELPYRPGEVLEGEVAFVYPQLDPKTRTLEVRMRFDNPGGALKPHMYAHVDILAEPRLDVVHVPRSAVIRSGEGERVVVALGDGRFDVRAVTAGIESGDRVEIREGLEVGERVVTSAQFLIDSEASLSGAVERMQGHAHGEEGS